jgi:hypothetical protein
MLICWGCCVVLEIFPGSFPGCIFPYIEYIGLVNLLDFGRNWGRTAAAGQITNRRGSIAMKRGPLTASVDRRWVSLGIPSKSGSEGVGKPSYNFSLKIPAE